MERVGTVEANGYITHKQVMTSHTGTHLECAKHWWDDYDGVEKLSLDKIAGKARVLRFACEEQPFYGIDVDMLKEAGADKLEKDDICIIATGWDKRIAKENYTWESPFITVEAAKYLTDKGIDPIKIHPTFTASLSPSSLLPPPHAAKLKTITSASNTASTFFMFFFSPLRKYK